MAAAEDLLYLPEWSSKIRSQRPIEVGGFAQSDRNSAIFVISANVLVMGRSLPLAANDLPLLRTRRFSLASLSYAEGTDHRSNDDFAAYVPCAARSSGRRACDRGAKR